jgi:hypothetical protein
VACMLTGGRAMDHIDLPFRVHSGSVLSTVCNHLFKHLFCSHWYGFPLSAVLSCTLPC